MTIKTQGGKVVTKGGKVSCECCGPAPNCCPYQASQLGVSLFYEDLPDEIFARDYYVGDEIGSFAHATVTGVLTKTNPFPAFLPYGLYSATLNIDYPEGTPEEDKTSDSFNLTQVVTLDNPLFWA